MLLIDDLLLKELLDEAQVACEESLPVVLIKLVLLHQISKDLVLSDSVDKSLREPFQADDFFFGQVVDQVLEVLHFFVSQVVLGVKFQVAFVLLSVELHLLFGPAKACRVVEVCRARLLLLDGTDSLGVLLVGGANSLGVLLVDGTRGLGVLLLDGTDSLSVLLVGGTRSLKVLFHGRNSLMFLLMGSDSHLLLDRSRLFLFSLLFVSLVQVDSLGTLGHEQ